MLKFIATLLFAQVLLAAPLLFDQFLLAAPLPQNEIEDILKSPPVQFGDVREDGKVIE